MNQYKTEQGSIQVNFPDKLKVDSPELRSIQASVETFVDILDKELQEIIKPLQNLPELPDLLRNIEESVTNNFENLFTSNVESDVLARQASIKVIESKSKFVKSHINKKQVQAAELVEKIQNDYKGYFNEVATEHENFLEKLDSHAYELVQKVYPKYVQEKFSFQSLPSNDFLSEHISNSAFIRSICFNEAVREAEKEIDNFLESRDSFYADIMQNGICEKEEGNYKIPFCFAEIEDSETGEIQTKLVFPWDIELGNQPDNWIVRTLHEIAENRVQEIRLDKIHSEKFQEFSQSLGLEFGVKESEIERFKDDCKTFIVED